MSENIKVSSRKPYQRWTEDEVKVLEHNITLATKELKKLLPGRSAHQIFCKRNTLMKRIADRPFSQTEIKTIIDCYNNYKNVRETTSIINSLEENKNSNTKRVSSQITSKVLELGEQGVITLRKRHNSQIQYNQKYYKSTQNARNNYRRYTKYEVSLILDSDYTDPELSKMLGRSIAAIQLKRHSMKLKMGLL